MATRSPGLTDETFEPTAAMIPDASWPRIIGEEGETKVWMPPWFQKWTFHSNQKLVSLRLDLAAKGRAYITAADAYVRDPDKDVVRVGECREFIVFCC